MFNIKENIYEAIKYTELKIEEIDSQECNVIRQKISEKFCRNKKKSDFLWEDLLEYMSISDVNAWKLLKKMVRGKCILFFNRIDENVMFKINSEIDLDYILSETYGFEFYVTDYDCSYLICFNHHDILYGCGTICEFLKLCV